MTDSPTRPAPLAVGDTTNDPEAIAALDAFFTYWRRNDEDGGKDVRTPAMRAALDAVAAFRRAQPTSGLADLSLVPNDIYVVSASTQDSVVYDVMCCSVPMAIGPEVRYTRAEAAEAQLATVTKERDDALDLADGVASDSRFNFNAACQERKRAESAEAKLAACEAEVARLGEELRQIERVAEMSASIMRDNERTSGWEGSERVARQFDRLAERAARRHDGAPYPNSPSTKR